MKTVKAVVAVCVLVLSGAAQSPHTHLLSLSFEENRGQAPSEAHFLSRGRGYTLALTPQGNRLGLRHARKAVSLTTQLVGANPGPAIHGEGKQNAKVHYLRGGQSITNIPTYARVRYERVYSGIDLVYYGNQQQLEYDFVVKPGGDANSIALHFEGSESVAIDQQGNLVLQLNQSSLVQHKPVIYQESRGVRRVIEGGYRLIAADTVAFNVAPYDHEATLVIDPTLSYSTFLGGSNGNDDARAVATDSAGNVYIAGSTTSTNFPTAVPIQANAGSQDPEAGLTDAFVTKLNAAGTAMVYSTYLGGANDDQANGIAVDAAGNAIIVGSTASTSDFPTTAAALRRTCNVGPSGSCLNAFVTKLSATGSALTYSTYLGGTGDDEARGVAVDSAGNAYVTGKTTSTNFPTTAGALSTDSSSGGFVTKLSPSGALLYSTYFGAGSGTTEPKGIAVDLAGNAYVTGATPSSPTTGSDVFITKINPTGTGTVYTQFIRGAKDDVGNAVAVDASSNVYVAGKTLSINFTTTSGVVQPTFGGGPAFRSSDAGANWSVASSGIGRSSLYALAIAPGTPSTIYAGGDDDNGGDVFKSTDGGNNWTSVSGGLPDARVHALAVDPITPSTIYAGTRSAGLFKSTNGGAAWSATSINTAFVTALAVDPVTPSRVYAGTDTNGLYKSTDGGSSWSAANDGLVTSSIHSILIDPTATSTVYVTTGAGIYKSTDGAATWNPATSGLFDQNVNAITIDPRNPNLLFAATNSAGIFRSLNGGAFWLASSGGLPSSTSGIVASALTVDSNTGTLYAAVSQSNASRVYKSANGITWTPTGLSTARVSSLAVDLGSVNVVAATTGGCDAFVAKWNASGALVYSTYLGGYRNDAARAIAVDTNGNVVVAGDTSSTNFPIANAVQSTFGGGSDVVTDAFAAKLNASATAIAWATYLGGTSDDFGRGVALDPNGNAYVAGQTSSPDFPATTSALMPARPGLIDGFVAKIADTSSVSFSVTARGGVTLSSQGGSSNISAGYVRIQPAGGSTAPSGMAIFGFRQNNVLVSEAAVPASPLISSGRIYAEISTAVNTGIAIANPNNQPVTVTFYFTDATGQNFGQAGTTIGANSQIAGFLNRPPFNSAITGAPLPSGTFTFTASAPVSVIALRGRTNERSEFLITTLPVADLSVAAGSDPILFPQFADGGGWTTQILLVNTTDDSMSGSIQFSASLSRPPTYTLPARSSFKFLTSGLGSTTTTGFVQVVPDTGRRTPSGVAVFSFKNAGITVSEAGVPTVRVSNAFRLYAELSGTSGQVGSIQTGVAIANPSTNPAPVTFELNTLSGISSSLTGSATIPANGQTAIFLSQIQGFSSLPNPLQGVLRVSTPSSTGISVIGIRGRYNERQDFLMTTTQPTDESRAASAAEQFFPHFADGGGYTTQFILFNGSTDQASSGSLRFFTQSGQTPNLGIR